MDQGSDLKLIIQDQAEVSGNTAGVSGGMLYVGEDCSADVTMTGRTSINSNTASTFGGVIQAQKPAAFALDMAEGTTLRNNSGLYGGCFSLVGARAEAIKIDSRLENNIGSSGGGVLALTSSSNVSLVSMGSGSSCSIEGNRAAEGGVVYVSEGSQISTLVVNPGCRVASNAAQSSGGFLSVLGASHVGAATLGGSYTGHTAGLHGGLVNVESTGSSIMQLTLASGSKSQSNSAGNNGGLLHVGTGAVVSSLVLQDHHASGNKAGGEGGLVAVVAGAALKAITINSSSIDSSQASQGGCISLAAGSSVTSLAAQVR